MSKYAQTLPPGWPAQPDESCIIRNDYPLTGLPPPETHFSAYAEEQIKAVGRPKDSVLFVDCSTEEQITLGEHEARVELLARILPSLSGIDPIDLNGNIKTMGILSHNHIDYPLLLWAGLRASVPIANIPAYVNGEELEHLLAAFDCRVIFVHHDLLPLLLSARYPLSQVIVFGQSHQKTSKIVPLPDGVSLPSADQILPTLADVMEKAKKLPPSTLPKYAPGRQVAYAVSSSGSTAMPKGIQISHSNVIAFFQISKIQAIANAEWEAKNGIPPIFPPTRTAPIRVMNMMPFFHSNCLITGVMATVMSNVTFYFRAKFQIEDYLHDVTRYKIEQIPKVVPMTAALTSPKAKALIASGKYSLESVVISHSGSAYLPPPLAKDWLSMVPNNKAFPMGWGQSEVRPQDVDNRPEPAHTPCGTPLPGCEARLVDPDTGRDLPPYEVGELVYRGPGVSVEGYIKSPKANQETFIPDGWVRTGDKMIRDDKGCFYFAGRVKETFKANGFQVHPSELVTILTRQPHIQSVLVAGQPAKRLGDGERAHAWIVIKGDYTEEEAKRLTFDAINSILAPHKHLEEVFILDELPRNSSGKNTLRALQLAVAAREKAKLRAKL